MIRMALGKYAVTRNSHEASDTVKMQAEVDLGRLVTSMATVHYVAWAIPAIGFFGTVRGLAGSMTLAGQGGEQLRIATQHLTIAFDCTLVALGLRLCLFVQPSIVAGQIRQVFISERLQVVGPTLEWGATSSGVM